LCFILKLPFQIFDLRAATVYNPAFQIQTDSTHQRVFEKIMHAQDDFKTGHLIFLERYYRAASEFGV
jgi:hypothetical protein